MRFRLCVGFLMATAAAGCGGGGDGAADSTTTVAEGDAITTTLGDTTTTATAPETAADWFDVHGPVLDEMEAASTQAETADTLAEIDAACERLEDAAAHLALVPPIPDPIADRTFQLAVDSFIQAGPACSAGNYATMDAHITGGRTALGLARSSADQ